MPRVWRSKEGCPRQAGDPPRLMVTVFVFIRQDDTLLLVKQNYGQRYWSLPGGKVEVGESIDRAAIREVKEETGLDIRLGRVVGLYSKPEENALAVTFAGECTGGALAPSHEISDCRYFLFDRLPEARPHLRQRVEDYLSDSPYAFVRTQ